MSSDLVERLRAEITWQYLPRFMGTGGMVTPPDEVQLVNPDGPEAADRITELEAESLAHKLHIAELSGNCLDKRDRITQQDAVIAGLVEALEKARSDLHLIALESRMSYDVQRMIVASKEHCHEALAKAKESRDV